MTDDEGPEPLTESWGELRAAEEARARYAPGAGPRGRRRPGPTCSAAPLREPVAADLYGRIPAAARLPGVVA